SRVFDAWTDPAQLRAWWGPEGFSCTDAAVDLRSGGQYRLVMRAPAGPEMTLTGTYLTVEPPHRLVYTWHWESGPPGGEPDSVVTVEFLDRDGDTEVVVTHGQFPPGHDTSQYEGGWKDAFDKLEAVFAD
ncbi:MAG: SRPBCC domain-containing protein, partial [Candidatus Dormibacteraeota bacterium]|nr:SRPBCC domain-containing protein [Candidatus Dormibacteraeota bacterium]